VSARAEPLEPTGLAGELLPAHTEGPRSFGWWGMVWLIVTETALFGSLLLSYFYLRFRSGPTWPPDGIANPDLALPLVMTAILWSSSIPVHVAERAIRRGNRRRMRIALALAWILGAAFLVLQLVVEYPGTLKEFTPRTDVYGSLFFTITGLHASHVFVGLMISLWVQVRASRGAFDEWRHTTVQVFAMYWHFVDAVWLFVLLAIYVSPRL
jgi:heme/copper-type cytochrome/quinol oxidase subunit 3